MHLIYIPGAKTFTLLKDIKKIMKDKKNKSKIRSLCVAVFIYLFTQSFE
jgi:hypothetical protein